MTSDELEFMTLAQFFALSAKVGDAFTTLQVARGLLTPGLTQPAAPVGAPTPSFTGPGWETSAGIWTPDEMAERARAKAAREAEIAAKRNAPSDAPEGV
jgi:hypothetical protein